VDQKLRRRESAVNVREKGRDVRVTPLGRELVLVSVSAAVSPLLAIALTDAEWQVAALAVTGLSNASIAARRGTSKRTIANQLAAIYAKLDVSGRRGLRASLNSGFGQLPSMGGGRNPTKSGNRRLSPSPRRASAAPPQYAR
jgi:DNA-binding CsgD family transcriptional regulator